MKNRRILALVLAAAMSVTLLAGCGGGSSSSGGGAAAAPAETVDAESLTFPLAEKAEISGLTRYAAGTEADPNNRTIYKRLEEKTNVHVNWKSIQGDQWGDKIALEMSNIKTPPEFISPAGLSDTDILKYAKQGVIIPLEDYIDKYMPNLCKVFEQAPEYRDMCTDENGHIWTLPWIEQLGVGKTAIQTIGNMPFINVDERHISDGLDSSLANAELLDPGKRPDMAVLVRAHVAVFRGLFEDLAKVRHIFVNIILKRDNDALLSILEDISITKSCRGDELRRGLDVGHLERDLIAPLVTLDTLPVDMDVCLFLKALVDSTVVGISLCAGCISCKTGDLCLFRQREGQ